MARWMMGHNFIKADDGICYRQPFLLRFYNFLENRNKGESRV